jgi:hypothetical protein
MSMTTTHTRTHTFTATSLVKPLVKSILEHPHDREWSLQGFGMLRTYLAPELRLHVWDARSKVPFVSEIHTHPWNFHSYVVAGLVYNIRYERKLFGVKFVMGDEGPFREQEILCGEGGHETDKEAELVLLRPDPTEIVREGEQYTQRAHEIHRSQPEDGTVTIIEREFLDDADHAFVYVPRDNDWVSAEPRPATPNEVEAITRNALSRWF